MNFYHKLYTGVIQSTPLYRQLLISKFESQTDLTLNHLETDQRSIINFNTDLTTWLAYTLWFSSLAFKTSIMRRSRIQNTLNQEQQNWSDKFIIKYIFRPFSMLSNPKIFFKTGDWLLDYGDGDGDSDSQVWRCVWLTVRIAPWAFLCYLIVSTVLQLLVQ